MNTVEFMELVLFDQGSLPEEEAIALFQRLIDSGEVWNLPGYYGRTAMWLIEEGMCMFGPKPRRTYWGQQMPSRFEVPDSEPGSVAYFKSHQQESANANRNEEQT